jgi:heme O synthase-like polyprenyltransferase
MFENRSKKERIIIYIIISLIVTAILSLLHFYQGYPFYYVISAAVIEFLCIFYVLYLPLKAREKQK